MKLAQSIIHLTRGANIANKKILARRTQKRKNPAVTFWFIRSVYKVTL